MDSDEKRRRARRRLAATAFLLSISLDGSDNLIRGTRQISRKNQPPRIRRDNTEAGNQIRCKTDKYKTIENATIIKGTRDAESKIKKKSSQESRLYSDASSNRIESNKDDKTRLNKLHLSPPRVDASGRLSSASSGRLSTKSDTRFAGRKGSIKDPTQNIQVTHASAEILNDSENRNNYTRTKLSRDTRSRNRRILLASHKNAPVTMVSSLIRIYSHGNNNGNNDNHQQAGAEIKHGSRGQLSSSSRKRRETTIKRQSSKASRSGDKSRGGYESAHQQGDQADLFHLMNMDRPGLQDVSYAAIFARSTRSTLHANLSLTSMGHVDPVHHRYLEGSRSSSPHQMTGDTAYDYQYTHRPIYGSSNVTTRTMSHHLGILGPHTTSYCGCFGARSRIHDSHHDVAEDGGDVSTDLNQHHYHAHLLDDPDLVAGKYATVLAFPSCISSVIEHVKPSDKKRELNERFKARFPSLQLTLSKLRSIKREMYQIGCAGELHLDKLIIAQAYVYFEKLCMKYLITKQNRKLCAGASLLISAKLNDIKGPELKILIERIETSFRLKRRDLIFMEFGVIVALDFALYIPPYELFTHYERLIVER